MNKKEPIHLTVEHKVTEREYKADPNLTEEQARNRIFRRVAAYLADNAELTRTFSFCEVTFTADFEIKFHRRNTI